MAATPRPSVRRKIATDYERSERQRLAAVRPVEPAASLAEVRPRAPMRQAAFREVSVPAGDRYYLVSKIEFV